MTGHRLRPLDGSGKLGRRKWGRLTSDVCRDAQTPSLANSSSIARVSAAKSSFLLHVGAVILDTRFPKSNRVVCGRLRRSHADA